MRIRGEVCHPFDQLAPCVQQTRNDVGQGVDRYCQVNWNLLIFEAKSIPAETRNGTVVGLSCVVQDITERIEHNPEVALSGGFGT